MTNNLQIARKNAGYTGAQVAQKLNITRNALSYYENNKREASYETLRALSHLYGVSIDYLLGNAGLVTTKSEITKTQWLNSLRPIEQTLINSILSLSESLQYQLYGYIARLNEV
mgnify:CR=1 FL=1